MPKYFQHPFAENGDRTAVPDESATNEVSYEQGYTPAYELPKTNPDRRNIDRQPFNGLHFDVTENLKFWQENGAPEIVADDGSGSPLSYSKGFVGVLAGVTYVALVDGTTTVPPSAEWRDIDLSELSSILTSGQGGGSDLVPYSETGQTVTGALKNRSISASSFSELEALENVADGQVAFVSGEGRAYYEYDLTSDSWEKTYSLDDTTPYRSYLGEIDASFGSSLSVFTAQQIESFSGNQYLAYWRHGDQVLTIAKRSLPAGEWERYEFDGLSGRDLITIGQKDNHYNCSIGIDTNGRIVICYNTRNSAITWRYSSNLEDITAWSSEQTGMTGSNESSAGYPTFFYGPSDELLFMYRDGVSGNGECNINAWDAGALSWSARQHPVITGTDTAPTTSPYWWIPPITDSGVIHLFWCWREDAGGVQGNFDMNYARSVDGGLTWQKSDGSSYALPITQSTAEVATAIPQNSNFLNQGTSAEDEDGNPIVAYQADNSTTGIPQLFITRLGGGAWVNEQVTNRYSDYQLSDTGNPGIPQARPGVLVYPGNRIAVIARDWEFGGGVEFYLKQSGQWIKKGPVSSNMNSWEPQWDRRRFLETGALDLLVGQVSARLEEPEWQYESPFEVWTFGSLQSIASEQSSRIVTVATAAGPSEPFTTTSTSYVPAPPRLAFSRPAFDLYPSMVRFVVRIKNSTTNDVVRAALRLVRTNDTVNDTIIFSQRAWNGVAGENKVLDSGWRSMPNFDGAPLDFGLLDLVVQADGGTADLSASTIMLGARCDSSDLPTVIV